MGYNSGLARVPRLCCMKVTDAVVGLPQTGRARGCARTGGSENDPAGGSALASCLPSAGSSRGLLVPLPGSTSTGL